MDEDNVPEELSPDWTEKSIPDQTYQVTITLTSKGKSSNAVLETRYSSGEGLDEFVLMSDSPCGKIDSIDVFPFAALLQLGQALNGAEIAKI